MAEDIPRDKDEALRHIAAAWDEVQATVAPLTEAQMTARPGGRWSVADNLAHLAEWERRAIGALARGQTMRAAFGLPEDTPEGEDTSNINRILWERHKDDPLPSVLAFSRDTHAELLRALEPLTYAQLSEPQPSLDGAPLGGVLLGNTADHYPDHLAMIREVLRAQAAGEA